MIDRVSQEEGILLNTIQSKALIGIGDYSTSSCLNKCYPYHLQVLMGTYFCVRYRFYRGGTCGIGKASGLHEFQWRIGMYSEAIVV